MLATPNSTPLSRSRFDIRSILTDPIRGKSPIYTGIRSIESLTYLINLEKFDFLRALAMGLEIRLCIVSSTLVLGIRELD